MPTIGETVTVYFPPTRKEHEAFMRGTVQQKITDNDQCWCPLYVVIGEGWKWRKDDPWGPYDGIPEVIAQQIPGRLELEFVERG